MKSIQSLTKKNLTVFSLNLQSPTYLSTIRMKVQTYNIVSYQMFVKECWQEQKII